ITLDQNVTVAQGVKIYRGDSGALNNKDGELLGLPAAISATGTYLGISRTGKPEWQGHLVDCDGPLSLQAMRAVVDTISIYGTTEPDLIITDHLTRSRYEALLTSLKRFVNPMQLEGGLKAIEFDGLPIVVDKDAPPQRMWFLNTRDWLWYSMKDIGWLDRHGAILHPVPDMDAWKAYLTTYRELVCRRPNNQAVLFNIVGEEPAGGRGSRGREGPAWAPPCIPPGPCRRSGPGYLSISRRDSKTSARGSTCGGLPGPRCAARASGTSTVTCEKSRPTSRGGNSGT